MTLSTRSSIIDSAAIAWPKSVMSARLKRTFGIGRRHQVDRGDLEAVLHQVLDAGASGLAAASGDDDHRPFLRIVSTANSMSGDAVSGSAAGFVTP